jgi:tRNA nucleotidyltransferase (CCA-adding enzyme)
MKSQNILKSVLREITPTQEEKEELNLIFEYVRKHLLTFFKEDVRVELQGSTVKGTSLKGSSDLDIFIIFQTDFLEENFKTLVNDLKEYLPQIGLDVDLRYASHPYIHSTYKGIDIDIVPCYDILKGENIRSAVDRTVWHTQFVRENLTTKQKNEVRLLKQFLKANGLYGASEKAHGFSGYLCELLIWKYGTFLKVLETEIHDWRDIVHNPIHFPDPVDENRNVAAALSFESYTKFIFAARQFLENPTKEAFDIGQEVKFDLKRFEDQVYENDTEGYVIKFENISDNEEILYSKAEKFVKNITRLIKQHDFRLFNIQFYVGGHDIIITIQTEINTLPNYKIVKGPNIYMYREFWNEFIKKHGIENVFVKKDRIMAVSERKYQLVYNLLKDNCENVTTIFK